MGAAFDIHAYNLTFVLQPRDINSTVALRIDDFATLLKFPVLAGNGSQAVSARQQITITLAPPQAIVTDQSGEPPTRIEFGSLTASVLALLASRDLVAIAHGWNIEGTIEQDASLRHIIDHARLAATTHRMELEEWRQLQLHLELSTPPADKTTLNIGSSSPDLNSLTFSTNIHFDSEPNEDALHEHAATLWSTVQATITDIVSVQS